MSDSDEELRPPTAKPRAQNRHKFKKIAERIDEVRKSRLSCNLQVAGALLLPVAIRLAISSGAWLLLLLHSTVTAKHFI
jgi:hypothetical protein